GQQSTRSPSFSGVYWDRWSLSFARHRLNGLRSSFVQNPSILGAAALARIHNQRTFFERDARQAARDDAGSIAPRKHERAQIDMARHQTLLDASWASRQRERRLRDEVIRCSL